MMRDNGMLDLPDMHSWLAGPSFTEGICLIDVDCEDK